VRKTLTLGGFFPHVFATDRLADRLPLPSLPVDSSNHAITPPTIPTPPQGSPLRGTGRSVDENEKCTSGVEVTPGAGGGQRAALPYSHDVRPPFPSPDGTGYSCHAEV